VEQGASWPWPFIALFVAIAAALIWWFRFTAHRAADSTHRSISVSGVATTVLTGSAGAALVVLVAGYVMTNLAADGHRIVNDPSQASLTQGDMYETLIWHASKAVPLVDIPGSTGWENPVTDPASPLGVTILGVRAVMALLFVGAVIRFYRGTRGRKWVR
jgi:hypothetical protein